MPVVNYDSCVPPPSRGGTRFKPNVLEAARAMGIETEGRTKAELCRAIDAGARLTDAKYDPSCEFPPSRGGMRYRPDLIKAAAHLGIDTKGRKKAELCKMIKSTIADVQPLPVVQSIQKPTQTATAVSVQSIAKQESDGAAEQTEKPVPPVPVSATKSSNDLTTILAPANGLTKKHEEKLIALGLLNISVHGPRCHVAQCDIDNAIARATVLFGGPDEMFEQTVLQVLQDNPFPAPNPDETLWDEDEMELYMSVMRAVWTAAPPITWYRVMRLYTLFLEGTIPASPTHAGPLTLDVQEASVKTLIDINRLGFVTMDSQPGVCQSFAHNNVSGVEVQREYIQGSYPAFGSKILFDKLVEIGGDYIDIIVNAPQEPMPVYGRNPTGKTVYRHTLKINQRRPFDDAADKAKIDGMVVTAGVLDDGDRTFVDSGSKKDTFTKYYNHPEQEFYPQSDYFTRATGTESYLFQLVARDYCRPGVLAQCLRYALCSIILDSFR